MQTVLVTGGLGYIGSHVVIELVENGYNVVILDNCHNSNESTDIDLRKIAGSKANKIIFHKGDLLDKSCVMDVFNNHSIDFVIHLAGLKSVTDSISDPLNYYQINLGIMLNLLEVMTKFGCKKLIFSSSANVYGNQKAPVNENNPTGSGITNPYGKTKYMCEEILKDFSVANQSWSVVILRYFNPIGAHSSGLIGENPLNSPNNLMPVIIRAVKSDSVIKIFGGDYPTKDGTCERDFVHVMDLANGHIIAIKKLSTPGTHTYNLGTGKPTSVLQLINTFSNITGKKIKYEIVKRRLGDIIISYADISKINNEFGWMATRSLDEMCLDAWKFNN